MFHNNKYTRWYYSIINHAKSQNRKRFSNDHIDYVYYENHHVVPKSLGGTNDTNNLVLLNAKEHFVVHILLPKMCVSQRHIQQMLNALFRMKQKTSKQQRYFNSRLYEYAKKHIRCPEEKKEKHRNRVTCLDITTGHYISVSSDVFHSSPNLIGINSGKKGQKRSDEFRRNRTGSQNSFYGKKHTEESKRKAGDAISKKLKGKPKSEEHRQKMRDAWKRRKGL